jgi:CubicO group peptidase (beta-lactamase class C family)
VRRGRLFHAWGGQTNRADVASAVKVVYVHMLLRAVELGLIDDLDAPVCRHFGALARVPDGARITWRHLATMTACYGVTEAPGEAFSYSDYEAALLVDALVYGVFGTERYRLPEEVLGPQLFAPLGCQDEPILTITTRLRISARDLARFGQLYLQEGRWGRRRLLSRAHVELATRTIPSRGLPRTSQREAPMLPDQRTLGAGHNLEAHLDSYGYGWWINRPREDGTRLLPAAPPDTFGAFGHGGRHALIVIPSRQLVVCWLIGLPGGMPRRFSLDGRHKVNRALELLAAAAL